MTIIQFQTYTNILMGVLLHRCRVVLDVSAHKAFVAKDLKQILGILSLPRQAARTFHLILPRETHPYAPPFKFDADCGIRCAQCVCCELAAARACTTRATRKKLASV
jgi:hypothetical protein